VIGDVGSNIYILYLSLTPRKVCTMCWSPSFSEYYDVTPEVSGKKKTPSASATMDTAKVFDHYKSVFGLRSKLPATNEIKALLKFYSVEDLMLAATNASKSPFFMEHNASRGPKWFYGKAERVEHYLNQAVVEQKKAVVHDDMISRINRRTRSQEASVQAKSSNLDARSVYVDDLPWS